jgi:hypothetical protein
MPSTSGGSVIENHSTRCRSRRHQETYWLAYLSPHLFICAHSNGENVKVVQELMRHASSRFTLEVYTQAKTQVKRDAQQRIVDLVLFRTRRYF